MLACFSAYRHRRRDRARVTPTIAEPGFPGYSLSAWLGIVMPAGTSRVRVERLSAELVKIVKSPDIGEKYAGLGTLPRTMGADEFNAFVKAEYARWGAIVKASGAKVD
jgi:tripartite-type tricarboxylate transporter receptor subunit TctC